MPKGRFFTRLNISGMYYVPVSQVISYILNNANYYTDAREKMVRDVLLQMAQNFEELEDE